MLYQPIFALIAVQFLFGGLPVASKFVLPYAHPMTVVVTRSLFASLFFLILMLLDGFLRTKRNAETASVANSSQTSRAHLTAKDHLTLMMLAFFGVTFNQSALFVALPKTSASITSIISPSIALFTLLFSLILGREKFEKSTLLVILLGALGVFVVVNPFQAHNIANPYGGETWANMLNVSSAASYAFYLALAGSLPAQIGTIRFSLMFFFYGFVLNLVVLGGYMIAVAHQWLPTPTTALLPNALTTLPTSFWSGLAYLLLGATALTYFLNMWAIQRVRPSYVGGFVCLQTIIGLYLSKRILHEELSARMITGSLMILTAIVLLTFLYIRRSRQKEITA
jgi:drug/metabolite transporter (DMT)-like permease